MKNEKIANCKGIYKCGKDHSKSLNWLTINKIAYKAKKIYIHPEVEVSYTSECLYSRDFFLSIKDEYKCAYSMLSC